MNDNDADYLRIALRRIGGLPTETQADDDEIIGIATAAMDAAQEEIERLRAALATAQSSEPLPSTMCENLAAENRRLKAALAAAQVAQMSEITEAQAKAAGAVIHEAEGIEFNVADTLALAEEIARAALVAAQAGGGYAQGFSDACNTCLVQMLRCRDDQKGKCCDDCYCVGFANAVAFIRDELMPRALRPPAAPAESEVMQHISANNDSRPTDKTPPLSASAPAGAQPLDQNEIWNDGWEKGFEYGSGEPPQPSAQDIAHLIVEHLNEDMTNAFAVGRMVLALLRGS